MYENCNNYTEDALHRMMIKKQKYATMTPRKKTTVFVHVTKPQKSMCASDTRKYVIDFKETVKKN